MKAPADLWDRLAKMHACCDVKVASAVRTDGEGRYQTVWTMTIRPRDAPEPAISIEAATMLDALVEGVTQAEARRWVQSPAPG